MARTALAVIALALLGTACVVHTPFARTHSASSAQPERCPPGHRWSDGTCHSTGKGHDPNKH